MHNQFDTIDTNTNTNTNAGTDASTADDSATAEQHPLGQGRA